MVRREAVDADADEEFEAGARPHHAPADRLELGRRALQLRALPTPDGCLLVFTHVFNPELGPGWQHAAGWETYLSRLDAHLAGGYLSEEDAHKGIDERMERYREAFGA